MKNWTARELAPDSWRVPHTAEPEAIREEIDNGRGFVVLTGFPVDAGQAAYQDLCQRIGDVIPQTLSGTMLYPVRDEGYRIQTDYGKPGIRTSKTNEAFDFHTDSPSYVAGRTPDVIGLLVLQIAKSGGESAYVNALAVRDVIAAERPDLLERLQQPFWVDRRAECPPGEEPVLPVPVFGADGVRYLRLYITKGHEQKRVPLTPLDLEALDYLDAVMRRPGMAVMVAAEPGDIQLVNNRWLLHSRTGFEDHPEPERRRHYVRIWLQTR